MTVSSYDIFSIPVDVFITSSSKSLPIAISFSIVIQESFHTPSRFSHSNMSTSNFPFFISFFNKKVIDFKSSSAISTGTDELSPIVYLSVTFPNKVQIFIVIISLSSLLILVRFESFKSSK